MDIQNTLHPLTLTKHSSDLLCGGYTLNSLWTKYFGKPYPNDINPNIVPSISNMDKIKKDNKNLDLFKYPWDLVKYNKKILLENLLYKTSRGDYKEIQKGVFVGKDVLIGEGVVFCSSPKTPIVIDNYSQIGALSYLEGPVYIGSNSFVIDHSSIKHNVSIGNTCKIGGEVEQSVISNFTNKQHFGYIGNSYIGEWVNLGAGTSNSDLKNTYGEISIDYQNQKINTEEIFLGCIVCDYVKTAINTNIYTGKIIGINTHLYGVVTSSVPSFINYTKFIKGKNEEFRLEEAIKIQKKMFARRGLEQTREDIDLIFNAFNETKEDRLRFLNSNI